MTAKPSVDEAWTHLTSDGSTFLVPRWIVGPQPLDLVNMSGVDTERMEITATDILRSLLSVLHGLPA